MDKPETGTPESTTEAESPHLAVRRSWRAVVGHCKEQSNVRADRLSPHGKAKWESLMAMPSEERELYERAQGRRDDAKEYGEAHSGQVLQVSHQLRELSRQDEDHTKLEEEMNWGKSTSPNR